MKNILLVGFLVALISGCNSQKITDPLSLEWFNIDETTGLYGRNGQERYTFYSYETIYALLLSRYANWQTRVEVVKLPSGEVVFQTMVLTDENGELVDFPVWYFVNVDETGAAIDQSGNYALHIVQAHHEKPWKNCRIPFTVVNSLPPFAQLRLTDARGVFKQGSFLLNEDIFLQASGLPVSTNIRIYIQDHPGQYNDGTFYNDVSGGFEPLITSSGGTINTTLIWPSAATPGAYDVIVDLEPFGEYNDTDLILNPVEPGFVVQVTQQTTDIIQDIACNSAGIYKNVFDDNEAIFARVNPLSRPVLSDLHSAIYLMPHKDSWTQDDPLMYIESGGSMQSPVLCLTNPVSQWLAKTRIRTETKPKYRQPVRLWPGDYDVILDVNNNRLYDPGTDVLDGGSRPGFTIPGEKPVIYFFMTAFTDYSREKTLIRALVVRNDQTPVTGVTVNFKVVKGPGTVNPTSDVTNGHGIAVTWFSGSKISKWSLVKGTVEVDGIKYKSYISIYHELPYTHNQGDLCEFLP